MSGAVLQPQVFATLSGLDVRLVANEIQISLRGLQRLVETNVSPGKPSRQLRNYGKATKTGWGSHLVEQGWCTLAAVPLLLRDIGLVVCGLSLEDLERDLRAAYFTMDIESPSASGNEDAA